MVPRFPSIASLLDPGALAQIVGPVRLVRREPMGTPGFSGSTHERLVVVLGDGAERRLVLKRVPLDRDWTVLASGDARGREAALLAEPALARVWDIFACPYVAYALGEGEVALLMDDLGERLFPDVRAPLDFAEEERLLDALARLHAAFWGAPAPPAPWLTPPATSLEMLAPAVLRSPDFARLPPALAERVRLGWSIALPRLPAGVRALMTCPGAELTRAWTDLPATVVHGDAKVANFALLADGRVTAFDWELIGWGPATMDLGWYLAVNASRLARPKALVSLRYRELLEGRLGVVIPEPVWQRMLAAATLTGARMLLWSKGAALANGGPAAEAEWAWWVDALEAAAADPEPAPTSPRPAPPRSDA
ncbi:MAG TPA: aminoglycoside phosphotransferase family protein [Longimicrobiales bacterium]|nr:aminoglycoside phosphotransferase family protein [Longimicrobiales bacterium]